MLSKNTKAAKKPVRKTAAKKTATKKVTTKKTTAKKRSTAKRKESLYVVTRAGTVRGEIRL